MTTLSIAALHRPLRDVSVKLPAPGLDPQPQRVEADEAGGVALVVAARPFLEGDEILVIERQRTLPADHRGVALVKLHSDGAAHMLLALVDQRLQHLALRREPEAVVDQLRITRHDLVLQMRSEEHTSELQSLMRISYAVFCLKKK